MKMRYVTALGMISLALLVSFTHAAWAQQAPTPEPPAPPLPPAVQATYNFPCTQETPGLNQLCISLSSEVDNVIVLSMVNSCASPSSLVLVSGRTQVPILTLQPEEEIPEATPITITVPAGFVLALQTDPEGCEEGEEEDEFICLNVTSTIQFDQPPIFCLQSQ
jgi:hypothetical protein